jgi:hypothetical protein
MTRDSSPDFAALQTQANRRRLIIFGVAAAIVVLGGAAAVVSGQRGARKEVEATIGDLRACLLGGPLDPKETASLRFRRLQLRALARSDADRSIGVDKLWPFSCRSGAGHASDLLKASASDADQKSVAALVDLLKDGTAISKDASQIIDAALSALDTAFPAPVPAVAQPLPPVARTVDSLAATIGLSRGLSRSFTEDNPGLSLPVLIDEEELQAPLFCIFRASGEDADCRYLTELTRVHGHGLRLLGTSDPDAPNLVFAGKRGAEGVFVTGSGDPVDRMYSYGGYASRDKTTSVLGWEEATRTLILTQKVGASAPTRTPLKPNFRVGNYFYGSQLLWDQVLVRGVTPNNERRLFVLPLAQKDKHSFALVDIGELPEAGLIRPGEEEQPHLTGCRTEKATVVRVRGEHTDFLTFRINGAFSQPVATFPMGVLGCYGTTATVVEVAREGGGSARLYHDTCTSAGCVQTALNPEALDGNSPDLRPREGNDVAAVDLDGKLLAIWLAGDRGGLRMRMGEPDKFAHAEDVVVLDDHISNGKASTESTILGFRLYSREHFAVLLLSTMAGVHAFRIDPTGAIRPWSLKLAK